MAGAALRCASSLRMARLLLRTEYRSACARSRSSRSPAGGQRCGGAGMRRCRLQGAAVPGAERCRGAERCGGAEILRRAEAGQCSRGAARRAIFRGGGERRLGEHARQLVVLLLRRLQAARRLDCTLPAWAKGGGIGGFGSGELKHPEAAAISTSGPASPHGSRAARRALWRRRSRARGTAKGL